MPPIYFERNNNRYREQNEGKDTSLLIIGFNSTPNDFYTDDFNIK